MNKKVFSAIFLPLLFILVLCISCGGKERTDDLPKEDTEAEEAAVTYYNLRVQGRFEEYVAAMHSCDGTTEQYQQGIEQMLRQHQNRITKEKKGVASVRPLRCELHNAGRMANIFLSVTYGDGSTEEILFPLVRDSLTWRIQ